MVVSSAVCDRSDKQLYLYLEEWGKGKLMAVKDERSFYYSCSRPWPVSSSHVVFGRDTTDCEGWREEITRSISMLLT